MRRWPAASASMAASRSRPSGSPSTTSRPRWVAILLRAPWRSPTASSRRCRASSSFARSISTSGWRCSSNRVSSCPSRPRRPNHRRPNHRQPSHRRRSHRRPRACRRSRRSSASISASTLPRQPIARESSATSRWRSRFATARSRCRASRRPCPATWRCRPMRRWMPPARRPAASASPATSCATRWPGSASIRAACPSASCRACW